MTSAPRDPSEAKNTAPRDPSEAKNTAPRDPSEAQNTAPQDPVKGPSHFRWVVIFLACQTSWLLYLHRYVFALIKPKLKEEWDLSTADLGLLDSAFSICYTAFQIPLGILVDVVGVHWTLTGMIFFWSLGLGMHAWASTVYSLSMGRALLGIGQAAVFAALSRITRTWVPHATRTTVQGWVGVFFGRIGGLSANLLIGALVLGILGVDWRITVYALTVIGLMHAGLFALLFRNSPRQHWAVNEEEANLIEGGVRASAKPRMTIRELIRHMSPRSIANLLVLNLQTILSTLADNIYSAWIPLFLFDVHGLNFKEMGFYSALPLLGGALGGAAGGSLNEMMIRRTGSYRWGRTLVGLAGKGIAGVVLLAALLMYDYPRLFCVMLFFVKFFSDWSLTTTWGVVTDISGQKSATVFAWNNSVAGIGAIVAPLLYGFMADGLGWIPVFITAAATYLVCGASWLAIDCTIPVVAEDE